MQHSENNSADWPQCWGKSEVLKKLLQAGPTARLEVVLLKRKGKPRGVRLSDEEHENNFWARASIKAQGCWEWKGCVVGKYRQARCGRNTGEQLAARACWRLVNGRIPNGMCVLHTCDNEACVRPDHLFIGTRTENNDDKLAKKRQWHPRGERNHFAVLTEEKVIQIRLAEGTQVGIASRFGCSRGAVAKIRRNQSWKHLIPKE